MHDEQDNQGEDTTLTKKEENDAVNNDAQNNDAQNNDAQNNDTQNNDAQNNDAQNNDAQNNDAQNNDAQNNDTQNSDIENNDTAQTGTQNAEPAVADNAALAVEESASSSDSSSDSESSDDDSSEHVQEETPATQQVTPVTSSALKLDWYVVHAYSGFEMKAKQALEERIRLNKMDTFFGQIHVPQETVVELVKGQKKTSNRKFFPGYILVQMHLNQDSWHLVKETPKVTGFVGDATDPSPMSEDEVKRVLDQVEEGTASPRSKMSFEQGETVKVIDGPFTDFNGTIEEVKPEKGKVKVLISIFGRATPVEPDFMQIEKS